MQSWALGEQRYAQCWCDLRTPPPSLRWHWGGLCPMMGTCPWFPISVMALQGCSMRGRSEPCWSPVQWDNGQLWVQHSRSSCRLPEGCPCPIRSPGARSPAMQSQCRWEQVHCWCWGGTESPSLEREQHPSPIPPSAGWH